MIHICAVDGCPNKSDTIIHYTLPEEPTRRQKWIEFLERGRKADLSCFSRICGRHFSEDSFTKLDLGFTTRLVLNVNAVPSIYPDGLTVQQKQEEADEGFPSEISSEVESGIIVTDTVSLACLKEEPLQDELSCDAMRIIKVEPLDDNGYGDSSFDQPTEEEMLDNDATIFKIEVCEDPINVDDGKPFHCSNCGEGFLNKGVLKQHEIKHITLFPQTSKSYHCKHCVKAFPHRGFLKAHEKIHANMESQMSFSCTECDRRFRNQSSLKKHMHNHLTRLKYPCPVCGEDFEMKGSLHFHIKTHPGERFLCKFCNLRFFKIDAYLKHVDRHTVVTPYYCDKCKIYQLTQRGFLLHQKRHARKELVQIMAEKREMIKNGGKNKNYLNTPLQHNEAGERMVVEDSDLNSPLQSQNKTETTPLETSELPSHTGPCATEIEKTTT